MSRLIDTLLNRKSLRGWHVFFLVFAIAMSVHLLDTIDKKGGALEPIYAGWVAWVAITLLFLMIYAAANVSKEVRHMARRLAILVLLYPVLVVITFAMYLFLFGAFELSYVLHVVFVLLLVWRTAEAFYEASAAPR